MTKLNNDFHLIQDNPDELQSIHDKIHKQLQQKCGIKDGDCVCITRTNRDKKRYANDDLSELYFEFDDSNEICAQQKLDSIHYYLMHTYEVKIHSNEMDEVDDDIIKLRNTTSSNVYSDMNDDEKTSSKRHETPSLTAEKMQNIPQFHKKATIPIRAQKYQSSEYNKYESGFRFYYWPYYSKQKNGKKKQFIFRDRIEDPGNMKADGSLYRFRDWYIEPTAKDFKEELLNLSVHFPISISLNQYKNEYVKATFNAKTEYG
eukprot:215556_1